MAGGKKSEEELNDLVDEITVDAHNDDEQLWAFRQVIEDEVTMPTDAFALGEPVTLVEIDYDGNERRGLTAKLRREDGSEHIVSASDLVFPEGSIGADYLAAYRTWLGIEPHPQTRPAKKPKAIEDEITIGKDVQLIVLAVKGNAISCRMLSSEHVLTLRPSGVWETTPGEIVTVSPLRTWRYANHQYLGGEIKASRTDIPALGLTPLKLYERGIWDPKEHYWGEPDEPIDPWARPMIKRGSRPEYDMEQVLPGQDPDDPDTDPILEAADMKEAGNLRKARRMLMEILTRDLRCLDAQAHLGNFAFPRDPDTAVRHYDIGVKIGELSLGKDFGSLLPWAYIDNRPFLRCLHGYGLCLWRFGRMRDAEKVFTRMLWLNPTDNQGARFNLYKVKEQRPWREEE